MSDHHIEFWFDFGSPNAWLAYAILPGIAERVGATLALRPFLLGGAFKATGNQSPAQAFSHLPAKMAWMGQATQRFLARHDVPYAPNPHFPVNTLKIMRGAMWVRTAYDEATFMRYVDVMFRHMWVEPKKLDEDAVLAAALRESGFDAAAFFEGIQLPDVKSALIEATQAAVDEGVFGAPTCVIGDQVFFGKDDIELLEPWFAARQELSVGQ